jgi:hypothetical protein
MTKLGGKTVKYKYNIKIFAFLCTETLLRLHISSSCIISSYCRIIERSARHIRRGK